MESTQKIPEILSGKRIDSIAHTFFKDISRSQLRKNSAFFLETEGEFREMSGKTKVQEGDVWKITHHKEIPENSTLVPWEYPLTILKEDSDWVAIEKPQGISVHPSVSEKTNMTIINALLFQFGKKNLSENSCEIDEYTVDRPGLVHRLDKDTSGVLLIAKKNAFHTFIQKNWGETKKIYYAVVLGIPPRKGKISSGIQRDNTNRQKMMPSDGESAKKAITYFEREKVSKNKQFSLLRIIIPTGRTHQIRVHLSSIGFPIIGDKKYEGGNMNRMYLHAHSLTFPVPNSKEPIEVISEIPKEFLKKFEG